MAQRKSVTGIPGSYQPTVVTVQPFSRQGTWSVEGGFRDRAHWCFQQVKAQDAEADRYFAQRMADRSSPYGKVHQFISQMLFSFSAIQRSSLPLWPSRGF